MHAAFIKWMDTHWLYRLTRTVSMMKKNRQFYGINQKPHSHWHYVPYSAKSHLFIFYTSAELFAGNPLKSTLAIWNHPHSWVQQVCRDDYMDLDTQVLCTKSDRYAGMDALIRMCRLYTPGHATISANLSNSNVWLSPYSRCVSILLFRLVVRITTQGWFGCHWFNVTEIYQAQQTDITVALCMW